MKRKTNDPLIGTRVRVKSPVALQNLLGGHYARDWAGQEGIVAKVRAAWGANATGGRDRYEEAFVEGLSRGVNDAQQAAAALAAGRKPAAVPGYWLVIDTLEPVSPKSGELPTRAGTRDPSHSRRAHADAHRQAIFTTLADASQLRDTGQTEAAREALVPQATIDRLWARLNAADLAVLQLKSPKEAAQQRAFTAAEKRNIAFSKKQAEKEARDLRKVKAKASSAAHRAKTTFRNVERLDLDPQLRQEVNRGRFIRADRRVTKRKKPARGGVLTERAAAPHAWLPLFDADGTPNNAAREQTRGRQGVYLFKKRGVVRYVGSSIAEAPSSETRSTDPENLRMWKTILRHFQKCAPAAAGRYGFGDDNFCTSSRVDWEISIHPVNATALAETVRALETELIAKHSPTDQAQKKPRKTRKKARR